MINNKYNRCVNRFNSTPNEPAGIWVNIKSIIYTIGTIILLIAGVLILPLGLLLLAVLVVYGFYRVLFTVRHDHDQSTKSTTNSK